MTKQEKIKVEQLKAECENLLSTLGRIATYASRRVGWNGHHMKDDDILENINQLCERSSKIAKDNIYNIGL